MIEAGALEFMDCCEIGSLGMARIFTEDVYNAMRGADRRVFQPADERPPLAPEISF